MHYDYTWGIALLTAGVIIFTFQKLPITDRNNTTDIYSNLPVSHFSYDGIIGYIWNGRTDIVSLFSYNYFYLGRPLKGRWLIERLVWNFKL